MARTSHPLLTGAIGLLGLLGLLGCQAPPAQQEAGGSPDSDRGARQTTEEETAISRESFEAGDTGSLEASAQDAARDSSPEQPRDP